MKLRMPGFFAITFSLTGAALAANHGDLANLLEDGSQH
jgi:hypothetical protein